MAIARNVTVIPARINIGRSAKKESPKLPLIAGFLQIARSRLQAMRCRLITTLPTSIAIPNGNLPGSSPMMAFPGPTPENGMNLTA